MTDQTQETTEQARPATPDGLAPLSVNAAWKTFQKKQNQSRIIPIKLQLPSTYGDAEEDQLWVSAIRGPMWWLIEQGKIPDQLVEKTQQLIELIKSQDPDYVQETMMAELSEGTKKEQEDTLANWVSLINACFCANVVEPTFTDDITRMGAESEPFWVGDVNYMDRMYVWHWSMGVDETVVEFFRRTSETLGIVADESGIPLQSVEPVRTGPDARDGIYGAVSGSRGLPIRKFHQGEDRGTDQAAEGEVANQAR